MRAICYTCPGYGLKDLPMPEIIEDDDVLIKVAYAGICGSDLNIVKGYEDEEIGYTPNSVNVIGHEGSGTVVKLGAKAHVKGLKEGDKVIFYPKSYCGSCFYCRNGQENFCTNSLFIGGAMADYTIMKEQMVYKLDDDADLLRAALVEPISVAQHAIDMCNIKSGMTACVVGVGGMGLLFVELLKHAGCTRISVSEPVKEKRETALKFGAEYTMDPFNEDVVERSRIITDGRGFDVVIEASGVVPVIETAYELTGAGGYLVLFAAYPPEAKLNLPLKTMFSKEIHIMTVYQSPYMFPRAVELFKYLNLDPFIKDIYKPEDWEEAFQYRFSGVPQKVIFDFN